MAITPRRGGTLSIIVAKGFVFVCVCVFCSVDDLTRQNDDQMQRTDH